MTSAAMGAAERLEIAPAQLRRSVVPEHVQPALQALPLLLASPSARSGAPRRPAPPAGARGLAPPEFRPYAAIARPAGRGAIVLSETGRSVLADMASARAFLAGPPRAELGRRPQP